MAPVDTRRFTGPENSVPYRSFCKKYLKSFEENCANLINDAGVRHDGRTQLQSRPVFMKNGIISQAKGSAYVEMKNTKVICSVFDPREIPHQDQFSEFGEVYCEVKLAPFSCARIRRQLVPDAEEKALSVALKKAIEPALHRKMFANYQVDVIAFVIENDGGCLAAIINAANLALTDAAIPMLDLVTSSTVAVHNNKIILDPTDIEEYSCLNKKGQNNGLITLSKLSELDQISSLNQVGSLDYDCLLTCLDILEKECSNMLKPVHFVILKTVQRGLEVKRNYEHSVKEFEDDIDKKIDDLKVKMKEMNK